MDNSTHLQTLKNLAELVGQVDNNLERSYHHSHHENYCNEWCKLWMMLAGAWYSLSWAVYRLEKTKLSEALKDAHVFAGRLLSMPVMGLTSEDINPWFVGYFLISAEHRIANTLDRLPALFFWPQLDVLKLRPNDPNDDRLKRIDLRYKLLLHGCPHSSSCPPTYLDDANEIVRRFAMRPRPNQRRGIAFENWLRSSPLAMIWVRVNAIKHKAPDAAAVSDALTDTRWTEAADALADLARLMATLTDHRQKYHVTDY